MKKRTLICFALLGLSTMVAWAVVSSGATIPLILDDDGSPDGVIALMYLLQNKEVDVRALTVCEGEAHPGLLAEKLRGLLVRLDQNIATAAGFETAPGEEKNCFPKSWRDWCDAFWCLSLPDPPIDVQTTPAYQLIVDVLRAAEPTEPVTILATGPLTNVALALKEMDTYARGNIKEIVIMGGAIQTAGNIASDVSTPDNARPCGPYTNTKAEWNFWVDPVAASEVLHSGVHIRLVPLDATNAVSWNREDARRWITKGTEENRVAGRLLLNMMAFYEDYYDGDPFDSLWLYDLCTAVVATHPSDYPGTLLPVDVCTASDGCWVPSCPGSPLPALLAELGQSAACCPTDCPTNRTWVVFSLDSAKVRAAVEEVFKP